MQFKEGIIFLFISTLLAGFSANCFAQENEKSKTPLKIDIQQQIRLLSSPNAVEPLIAALKDKDEKVREKAAWSLGVIKDARALPALIAAVNDSDPKVRKNADHAIRIINRKLERQ